jgi:tRNA-dihydrouridine synthase
MGTLLLVAALAQFDARVAPTECFSAWINAHRLQVGLVIHARHGRQDSTEKPSWSAIEEAKRRARIPIIGNGDVVTREDWERMSRETGAVGALIARGAIRSPWVFRGLRGLGNGAPDSLEEIETAEQQCRALVDKFGTEPKFTEWHREGFSACARGSTVS